MRLPPTLKTSDELVEGVVVANMTNWRDVFGNLTLKLQYAPPGHHYPHPPHLNLTENFTDVHEEFIMPVSIGCWESCFISVPFLLGEEASRSYLCVCVE